MSVRWRMRVEPKIRLTDRNVPTWLTLWLAAEFLWSGFKHPVMWHNKA